MRLYSILMKSQPDCNGCKHESKITSQNQDTNGDQLLLPKCLSACVYVRQDELFCMPFQIWTMLIKVSRHNLCRADKALAYQMESHTIPALRPLVIWRVAASLLGCTIHVLLMENLQGDTTTQLSCGSQKHWSWEGQRLSFKGEIPSEGRISLWVSHAGALHLAWRLLCQPSPSSLQQPPHRHNQGSSSGVKES